MLDKIRPESLEISETGLKALIGVFTIEVECAQRDAQRLIEKENPEIYCRLETDDGGFYLIGFSSEARRLLYKGLRAVNGIGRRSALIVLDCGEAVDVLRAVSGKDKSFFRTVPGVGPKKIDAIINTLGKRYKDALPIPIPIEVSEWVEARDALLEYNVNAQEADQLLHQVADKSNNAEELLSSARDILFESKN